MKNLTIAALLLLAAPVLADDDSLPDTTDPVEVRVALYEMLAEASDEVLADHYAVLKAEQDAVASIAEVVGLEGVATLPSANGPTEMRNEFYDLIAQSSDGELVGYYRVLRDGRARGFSARTEERLKKWHEWRSDPENEKIAPVIERLFLDECLREGALRNEALLKQIEE